MYQTSSEGFINTIYKNDLLPLKNFKIIRMVIEKVIMANGTSGGQYMNFWLTRAPIGSTATVVDNMSILHIKNDVQTQYIGNVDNEGIIIQGGFMYYDFPYTYDTFPSTGLSIYTQSSAGGTNVTWLCNLIGVL